MQTTQANYLRAVGLVHDTLRECAQATDTGGLLDWLESCGQLRITARVARSRGGIAGGRPAMVLNLGHHIAPAINDRFIRSWTMGAPRPGKRWWQIAVLQRHYRLPRWHEYLSFDRDPVVGGFLSANWEDHIRALVAHEYAHVVQYRNGTKGVDKPHGQSFLRPYRTLREAVVNPRLPEQPPQGEQRRVIHAATEGRFEVPLAASPAEVLR